MKRADHDRHQLIFWRNGRRIVLAASATIGLAFAIIAAQSAMPRDVAATDINGPAIPSSGKVSAANAVLRTPADMDRDSNLKATVGVVPGVTINAPTIPLAEYNSLKAWAAQTQTSRGARPSGPSAPLVPTTKGVNFAGAVEGENSNPMTTDNDFFPPDTHMAAGLTQLLETTNASIDIYSKVSTGTPAHLKSISLNSFTGNVGDQLGDSRVIYDQAARRFIVTIDDFSGLTNGTKPSYYLAVSTTPYAAAVTGISGSGSFYIFPVRISTSPSGLFYDYPQLGMDQDAVLLTANMFNGNSFFGATAHAIAKQRIFNGLGFSFSLFFIASSSGTLAPPIVQTYDQNANDYFLTAPVGSGMTALRKYTMTNSSRSPVNFAGPITITVPSYITPPPAAAQPAPCNAADGSDKLDTLDGRFQNASFQSGAFVWNVHTLSAGLPTPMFYEVNAAANTLVQNKTFFKSVTSNDFNPAISGVGYNVIVTWSATDPAHGLNPMVMFGGRVSTDPLNTISVQATPAFTSPACLTGNFEPSFGTQRWGDYSSVSLDAPSNPPAFWILNEDVPTASSWGTRGVRVGN